MYYGFIYLIRDLRNNKVYIGKRKGKIEKNRYYYGSGNIVTAIHKKHGIKYFSRIILGTCESEDNLNEAEKACIEFFHSTDFCYGYNLRPGGDGGDTWKKCKHIKERKSKQREKMISISEAYRGKSAYDWWLEKYGKEEADRRWKERYELQQGIVRSDAHKLSISKANKGKKTWNTGLTKETDNRIKNYGKKVSIKNKGRLVSKETCKKLSNALKGRTYEDLHGKDKAEQLKLQSSLSRKGRIPWNKGLTQDTDERVKKNIEGTSATLKKQYSSGQRTVWNKGLTAKTDIRVKQLIDSRSYSKILKEIQ